ncbi:MAG: L-2-hydroxyglutarate oxidase [Anaerolineales bacterium]
MKRIAIIGGGILGAATAEALTRARPDWQISLLEKESALASHQSGRNSGVIHSGVYYRPGTLKARFCREGKQMLEVFCRIQGIPIESRGKLIVAVDEVGLEGLRRLERRGRENYVECRLVSASEANQLEPRVRAVGALYVSEAAIVDYGQVTAVLAGLARDRGCRISRRTAVFAIEAADHGVLLRTSRGEFQVDGYIGCAGLHADRLARAAGLKMDAMVVPFRGEYYRLKEKAAQGLRRLIYPAPDPTFPFLGVHLTPTMDGEFLCGPNAVLALAREGYSWAEVDPAHLFGLMTSIGFLRLAARHWRFGLREIARSLNKRRFAESVSRLVEGVTPDDLLEATSGVRAQLVSSQGELKDDFVMKSCPGGLHLLNAPSPAATASLRIGQELANRAVGQFGK